MSVISKKASFASDLLRWYDTTTFQYPWRESKDPYGVWLSEIMLQQTRANTVVPYYNGWLESLPNISAVANSNLEYILKKWEGLGYYARARNFHSACKIVATKFNSHVPKLYNEFISLPGVGPYVASAVMSIAYNLPLPAVDGNAYRVFSRVYSIDLPPSKSKEKIYSYLSRHISNTRPGDFNQAIMDLGRIVCTPTKPHCNCCPLQQSCTAYLNNSVDKFPIKINRGNKPQYKIAVGVVQNNGQVLISKRKEDGLLGGLWEFPGGKIINGETSECCIKREVREELGVYVSPKRFITQIQHDYSHFSIILDAYFCDFLGGKPQPLGCADWKWVYPDDINKLPFPKANHKLFGPMRKDLGLC